MSTNATENWANTCDGIASSRIDSVRVILFVLRTSEAPVVCIQFMELCVSGLQTKHMTCVCLRDNSELCFKRGIQVVTEYLPQQAGHIVRCTMQDVIAEIPRALPDSGPRTSYLRCCATVARVLSMPTKDITLSQSVRHDATIFPDICSISHVEGNPKGIKSRNSVCPRSFTFNLLESAAKRCVDFFVSERLSPGP